MDGAPRAQCRRELTTKRRTPRREVPAHRERGHPKQRRRLNAGLGKTVMMRGSGGRGGPNANVLNDTEAEGTHR